MARLLSISLAFIVAMPFLVSAGDLIVGEEVTYVTGEKDTPQMIASRHGVAWTTIAAGNGLAPNTPLRGGLMLKINTRRIVPKTLEDGVVINIPDRTLYLFRKGRQPVALPVGLGTQEWQTPEGKFSIVSKRKDPTWIVPQSIQEEYLAKGKEVKERVPPGPDNPLGKYAIKTSLSGIMIHGTTRPTSVYRYGSHGCIRMLEQHIAFLFANISQDSPGEIIYEAAKVASTDDGKVFVEIRHDVYRKHKSLKQKVMKVIEARGLSRRVDRAKLDASIKNKTGMIEDVSAMQQSAENITAMRPM